MTKKKKESNETINDVLSEEIEIPLEEQLFGKNPKRTQLLRDLWFDQVAEQLDEEKDMPDEAKRELLFLMTANAVLDMVMDSVPEEMAADLSYFIDNMMAMAAVNQKYDVDILEACHETISKVKREEYATDEEFEAAVTDKEEKWWITGKQLLGGRSPNDAVAETLSKYGLNR
ncbi:MAG: hypothetical protein FWD37_05635 [Methanomassiliicoccaceae archaeon]|nr:hypothetical protein [Methanomassiliicoccaceae archaeon]